MLTEINSKDPMLLTYFYRKQGDKLPTGALQVTSTTLDNGTLQAIDMLEKMGYDLKTTDILFAGYYT